MWELCATSCAHMVPARRVNVYTMMIAERGGGIRHCGCPRMHEGLAGAALILLARRSRCGCGYSQGLMVPCGRNRWALMQCPGPLNERLRAVCDGIAATTDVITSVRGDVAAAQVVMLQLLIQKWSQGCVVA